MAFLQIDRITKKYGEVVAVDDVSFSVDKGEFVSLLGPSGCGKTTTLQMIAGFVAPSDGRIELGGRDLSLIPARNRGLGIVFQTYALFMHMTVRENVAFGLEMRKTDKADLRRRVDQVLELVKLSALADRYPRAMSGGQRQRVALARALVIEPELLLLDEPLSNLDAKLREEMQLELRRIQREAGVTTLMVTHDQSEALAMSDRIVVMESGKLLQADHPFNVYENPGNSFVSMFLGQSNNFAASLEETGPKGAVLDCAGITLKGPQSQLEPGPVEIAIRPERIDLVADGKGVITGTVKEQIFLGAQWMLAIDTQMGEFLVAHRNTGQREIGAGDVAHLSWKPQDVRILPAQQGAGA